MPVQQRVCSPLLERHRRAAGSRMVSVDEPRSRRGSACRAATRSGLPFHQWTDARVQAFRDSLAHLQTLDPTHCPASCSVRSMRVPTG